MHKLQACGLNYLTASSRYVHNSTAKSMQNLPNHSVLTIELHSKIWLHTSLFIYFIQKPVITIIYYLYYSSTLDF